MSVSNKGRGWFGKVLSLPNDDPKKIAVVALLLCLVCSILVSVSAVVFKPLQVANKQEDIRKNILAVAGLWSEDADVNALFEQFDVRVVELATGEYAVGVADDYDQYKVARDPAQSVVLANEDDLAGISRRALLATVYLLMKGNDVICVILPVHGYGLWSTLYGFISLQGDFNTIRGLQFYAHAETPGLGGEVDNPRWRALWRGKKAFDEQGELQIKVVRGHVDFNVAGSEHQVDGLSGATLTSRGVSNLVNYWLGDDGFGPYLAKMKGGGNSYGR